MAINPYPPPFPRTQGKGVKRAVKSLPACGEGFREGLIIQPISELLFCHSNLDLPSNFGIYCYLSSATSTGGYVMFRFIIVVIAMCGCALGLVLAVEILSVNCNFDYCTSEAGPLVGFIVPGLLRNRWLPYPYEIEFIAKAFVPIVLLSVATILRAFRSQYELPPTGNNLRLIKRIYDTIILTLVIAAIADMVVLWTGGVRRGSNAGYAAYEIELLEVMVLLTNVSALGIAFVHG